MNVLTKHISVTTLGAMTASERNQAAKKVSYKTLFKKIMTFAKSPFGTALFAVIIAAVYVGGQFHQREKMDNIDTNQNSMSSLTATTVK